MITSLTLGLIAALCWGIHDICVRIISQRISIFASIFTVLTVGALILAPICLYFGNWQSLSGPAIRHSVFSGALFTLAVVGLYKAFSIGPVRLVAPIVGSFPILSVGLAIWHGQVIFQFQILAVLAIIFGIFIVAQGDGEDSIQNRNYAIFWAICASVGFFSSFAFGQTAAALGAELPVIWLTRLASILALFCAALPYRTNLLPKISELPILIVMGLLDAVALAVVIYAGTDKFSVFASVAASIFGLITIVLAWIFLKEKMTIIQWFGVLVVFSSIAILTVKSG
ncbi:MAG: DMT family transporter [Planktomarina sp.]|nr:DMT family transporter [Planktomarina sp.]